MNGPVYSREVVEQYIDKKPARFGKKLSAYLAGYTEARNPKQGHQNASILVKITYWITVLHSGIRTLRTQLAFWQGRNFAMLAWNQ